MWICCSWPLDVTTRGVRSASRSANINSHIHITLHMSSNTWNLLLSFRGCFGGVGVVTSDITLPCSLTVYYPNYSEIKEIPTFSWRIQNDCQIHPIIYIYHDALQLLLFIFGGVDLPEDLGVDLPNLNSSWPGGVSNGEGGRSASLFVNMNSHCRNVNLLFLTTKYQYWGGRSASWSVNMNSHSRNVNLLFLTTRCHYWGIRSTSRSANMNSHIHITC